MSVLSIQHHESIANQLELCNTQLINEIKQIKKINLENDTELINQYYKIKIIY